MSEVSVSPAVAAVPTFEQRVAALPQLPETVQYSEAIFRFKTKDGAKRQDVNLLVPVPTAAGIISILESSDTDPKSLQLLLDTMAEVVVSQAREQVNDDVTITQETLNLEKLLWGAIASIEPATRKGAGIPDEVWKAFSDDFCAVMAELFPSDDPDTVALNAKKASNTAKIFVAKLNPVKTNKNILQAVSGRLDMWFTSTKKAEDFTQVYEYLSKRISDFLSFDENAALANLI